MTQTEALKLALEALEAYGAHTGTCDYLILLTSNPPMRKPCSCGLHEAITSLRQAIEQAEKREWVGLTQKELDDLWDVHHDAYGYQLSADGYERAIEAKLKEKNNVS